jgi:uncharacterized membrane protein
LYHEVILNARFINITYGIIQLSFNPIHFFESLDDNLLLEIFLNTKNLQDSKIVSKKGEIMNILIFLIAFVIFFIIDILWLGFFAKKMYQTQIGYILAKKPNWYAAIVFYILYIIFLMIFAIVPALDAMSLSHAMLYGGLYGFITYATYDLTNLATLEKWSLKVTLIDITWGTFLGFSVSTLTYLIGSLL